MFIKAEVGSDVTLAVNSGYTGVVDYTWQDDDSFETLSKEASYTISNASPGDSGWYYCRATDE